MEKAAQAPVKPMPVDPSDYVSVERTFRDLSDAEVADIEKASALAKIGWGGGVGWDEVLRSPRVLLISEAGAGKTRECREQRDRLIAMGEAAFFFDLATLATEPLRDALVREEETRFDAWLASQSDIATFFLDSIDELKLTLGNFELALKRFAKALDGQISRARIVVTTRPVPFDRALVERMLPIPSPMLATPKAEAFADMMMERGDKSDGSDGPQEANAWRTVGLMPLSQEQRRIFAVGQGIPDPDAMLDDIRVRDAEEFAGRPQDLIELCADWRDYHRIRSHLDQVVSNIAYKLKPRTDRPERVELSLEAAVEGASRLALAAMLTRKLTLRHSVESDRVTASEPALDVSKILVDWTAAEQATLLERPLFGFASYGRVRFHHRSVVEFLAARRLDALLARGAPIKGIKRLLFAETAQGQMVVRPSMRPVAAWLASWHPTILDDLVRLDASVLLDFGDPQSLSIAQRSRALEAYVDRHRTGGWRGLQTPSIQVRRFAAEELAGQVSRLWGQGIENGEVRELLLRLIAAGRLRACGDLTFATAMDENAPLHERTLAIEALLRLGDLRVNSLSNSLECDTARWPAAAARRATVELFPAHMPLERLKVILARVVDDSKGAGDFTYRLCQEITHADLGPDYLDGLRQALFDLVADGLTWKDGAHPSLRTPRPDLLPALTSACCRQASEGVRTDAWTRSALLAVRLTKREYTDEKPAEHLRRALDEMPALTREKGFWNEAALLEALRPMKDAYNRLFELTHNKGIVLDDARDGEWVRRRLADPATPLHHREMMLWAEMVFLNRHISDYAALLRDLLPIVADAPRLVAIVEERRKPRPDDPEMKRWEAESAKRTRQAERKSAKAHGSWVAFWREVARDPDAVFHPERAENTAWNLWRAVERSGGESRATGWNRRLIEQQFGRPVADQLRETMKAAWRKDTPTLASERPKEERNTFLVRWQFGLAGITAESEDPNWAKHLTESEAELACRYVPMQLSGFPPWLETLAVQHPEAIDRVLGQELSLSLADMDTNGYAVTLQDVGHAPPILTVLFVPRIRAWLAGLGDRGSTGGGAPAARHIRQAVGILIQSGSDEDRRFVETEATRCLAGTERFGDIWLSALLRLRPAAGVDALETCLKSAEIAPIGAGVRLFGSLFDGDRGAGIDLRGAGFVPPLLLRILRLAYRHVRLEDDVNHEGSYTPDVRDHAERARNAILSAVLAAPGPEGWSAKLSMVGDPVFRHIRDRTLALAAETAAEEADGTSASEAEFVVLDRMGEMPPSTRDAMFALMRDRLVDLDDLLLRDTSPRELWASIKVERIMRRALSNALYDAAKGVYVVDQEAVTADEKETDIRLRSTASTQQATIELKLGDDRPGRDLFDTLRQQLLTKYMAAEDCRAGCLLVTIAKEREWDHPLTGKRIGFEELMRVLNEEAEAISREVGGTAKLMVKGLDLRPRLGRR
jgi:hypothetical protein